MKIARQFLSAVSVVGLLAFAAPASAAQITGQFGIAGSFTYDNLYNPANPITATNFPGAAGFDFQVTPFPPPPNAPTAAFLQVTVATGYFGGLGMAFGDNGRIANITNVNPPTNVNYAFVPAGTPVNFPNFLSLFSAPGAAGLHFDITSLPLQTGAPACIALPTCTEGPFSLTQTALGVDVAFDVVGNFIRGGDSGAYIGNFTFSVAGLTLATLGQRLLAGQDIACGVDFNQQPCAFAATFKPVEAVPEPATMLTFGVGSLVLGAVRRRKNAKKA